LISNKAGNEHEPGTPINKRCFMIGHPIIQDDEAGWQAAHAAMVEQLRLYRSIGRRHGVLDRHLAVSRVDDFSLFLTFLNHDLCFGQL
jgi:hypothetical protein